MKSLKEIKTQLETLKPELKERFGVDSIGVFGSYSRGEQTKRSDIDVLVVFSQNAHVGFFKFLELEEFLTEQLRVKVDLVTKGALKPVLKDQILRETVYA
ncbi:MAG: nucleotidyltransferase family protein [Candidatus Bathyarchaeota archaeon]|nr:nucleotidyltransferase family protein [Candidatus Bathyarchaeota archaeon]